MYIRDLLKQCVNDHLNKRGELHCWVDPEGEAGVFSSYGTSTSRSYLVCMAAFHGVEKFDGDLMVGDDLDDDDVNQAFDIRCRGTYLGTFDSVVRELKSGIDVQSVIGAMLN